MGSQWPDPAFPSSQLLELSQSHIQKLGPRATLAKIKVLQFAPEPEHLPPLWTLSHSCFGAWRRSHQAASLSIGDSDGRPMEPLGNGPLANPGPGIHVAHSKPSVSRGTSFRAMYFLGSQAPPVLDPMWVPDFFPTWTTEKVYVHLGFRQLTTLLSHRTFTTVLGPMQEWVARLWGAGRPGQTSGGCIGISSY